MKKCAKNVILSHSGPGQAKNFFAASCIHTLIALIYHSLKKQQMYTFMGNKTLKNCFLVLQQVNLC